MSAPIKSPGNWRLLALIAALLLVMTCLAAVVPDDPVTGTREAIRLTARTSLLLFSLAFVASSLHRLLPGRLTEWVLENRRMFGLGFAFSHLLHAAALVRLARIDPILFDLSLIHI